MPVDPLLERLRASDPSRSAAGDATRTRALLTELIESIDERPAMAPDRGSMRRPRGAWFARWFGALPAALGIGVTVAVLVVAVSSLRSRPVVSVSQGNVISSHTVMGLLGVLHRPETKADRELASAVSNGAGMSGYGLTYPFVRRAMIAPWGRPIFILAPPIDGRPASWTGQSRRIWLRGISRQLTGEMAMGLSQPMIALTATNIAAGTAVWSQAADLRSVYTRRTDVAAVVPNGVSTVEFVLPRQPVPIVGAPVYPQVRYVTVPVHNNVAAAVLDQICCHLPGGAAEQQRLRDHDDYTAARPPAMIWRGADGRVIKTIGDVAAADRVVRVPTPAPETTRSRAAERDPATPNPVWITPHAGYPNTGFEVHFRAQLNGAQYYYMVAREGKQLTPTQANHCAPVRSYGSVSTGPSAAFPGENFGLPEDLHPNSVRGTIWTGVLTLGGDPVHPPPLCPGTYRVSVGVANLGIFDHHSPFLPTPNRPYRYQPFGTAVVTVRPAPSSDIVWYLLAAAGVIAIGLVSVRQRRRRRT
jgi:hypothetical protein